MTTIKDIRSAQFLGAAIDAVRHFGNYGDTEALAQIAGLVTEQLQFAYVERPTPRRPPARLVYQEAFDELLGSLSAVPSLQHAAKTEEQGTDMLEMLRGLYDLVALAFGTSREDAKKRLLAAMYGGRGAPVTSEPDPEPLA